MKKRMLSSLSASVGVLMVSGSLDSAKADEFQMGQYRVISRAEAERDRVDTKLYLIGLGLVSALSAASEEPILCMGEVQLPLSGAQWRTIVDSVDNILPHRDDARVSLVMFSGFWELFKCR